MEQKKIWKPSYHLKIKYDKKNQQQLEQVITTGVF